MFKGPMQSNYGVLVFSHFYVKVMFQSALWLELPASGVAQYMLNNVLRNPRHAQMGIRSSISYRGGGGGVATPKEDIYKTGIGAIIANFVRLWKTRLVD